MPVEEASLNLVIYDADVFENVCLESLRIPLASLKDKGTKAVATTASEKRNEIVVLDQKAQLKQIRPYKNILSPGLTFKKTIRIFRHHGLRSKVNEWAIIFYINSHIKFYTKIVNLCL